MESIAYCKIYPSIGIARLGDSEEGYFIGPEFPDNLPHKHEDFTFRDSFGKIKRQVAQFRIYAFDQDGNVLCELTSKKAKITWKAQLANKKAAWFQYAGTKNALDAFQGTLDLNQVGIRNNTIGQLEYHPEALIGAKYKPTPERASKLEITTDEIEISGTSLKTEINNQEHHYEFLGKFKRTHPVYLGELRTDESGRLLVFGGHGKSDAINENGNSIKGSRWIQNYANNDDWFDDTSDGYVKAEVILNEGEKPVEVRGASWVIVAPPDFAPDNKNLVTMFDVMEEVTHNHQELLPQEFLTPRGSNEVIYDEDIKPIFERMFGYRWVNDIALRGHGFQKPGDFQNSLNGDLGDPSSKDGQKLRKHIFEMIRIPIYERPLTPISEDENSAAEEKAKKQANAFYMPPFSGDEGDQSTGDPPTWLTVTHLQHARLKAWSEGNFIQSKEKDSTDKAESLPFHLTQTVLEQCVGGAFFPGIEMTAIARHPGLYKEAYRLNDEVLEPGDVTKYMALPWQADFYECQTHWWPAQRPDDVIVDEDFEEIFSSFEEETTGDYEKQFELVLFNRKRWDRGLGSSRPSDNFLQTRLLPEPQNRESIDQYINGRTNLIFRSLFVRTPAASYRDVSIESVKYIERLPSPWRLQFLTQEIFDQFAGRYFHLIVPSPEIVFSEPGKGNDEKPELPKPASELHSSWSSYCTANGTEAIKIVNTYTQAISEQISEMVKAVFTEHPASKNTPQEYYESISADVGAVNFIESVSSEDFSIASDTFKRLRFADMTRIMLDVLYLRHLNQSGDVDMVDKWNSLGFVVEKKKTVKDRNGQDNEITVLVETERSRYDGLSFRDYFYFLMNIEKYPDFVFYAKDLAKSFFKEAEGFINQLGLQDSTHPESFVDYNETNFEAKLEQIYEILRAQANNTKPWMSPRNRAEQIRRILDLAPFNQTDGSWLRNISRAGPSDEMHGLLFDIWSDEIGNGNPSLHHGNLYTTLLQQLGHWLPEVSSKAYADNPNMPESSFIGAVVPLAISQHSGEFLPELLGMTLFLEWEVLSLVPGIKRWDYFGIDSHFLRMHIAIDNATEGHGYQAKRAVQLYLDRILKESGPEAMQQSWRRIWTGFVAFALGGSGIYSNDAGQSDDAIGRAYPGTPADRIAEIMRRKRLYGNLNHLNKKIGGFRINDMFDDPPLFLEELAQSPWIEPGDPERSRLLSHLTSFDGPMYKIFDKEDLDAWRDWVIWLGKEGDTAVSKRYIGKGEAMLMLLTELRSQAISAHGHARYKLKSSESDNTNQQEPLPVSEWFSEPDLKKLMKALKNSANGWAIPGSPENSPLVIDLASGVRPMGKILDQRFPTINNRIGRLIIVEWILAGCPIPGEKTPELSECGSIKGPEVRQLLVQEYGMGAVH